MRGQYVSLDFRPTTSSDDAAEEIRRAIDGVRFSVDPRAPRHRPRECLVVPISVVVSPIDRVDGNTIVPIRGHVLLAFFLWFEELRSRIEDQQTMLDRCQYEEYG